MASGIDAARERALAEAVRRKREQLEDEMEVFRGLKEREFRAFEVKLRGVGEGVGSRDDVEVLVGRVEGELKAARARIKVGKGKKGKGEVHEREGEFEGVFTPRFLGLLGGEGEGGEPSIVRSFRGRTGFERISLGKEKGVGLMGEEGIAFLRGEEKGKLETGSWDGEEGKDEARRVVVAATKTQEEREEVKKEIANARRGGQSMLSCSAEYRRSGMTSPPARPARPLSSSVPPEHASDHPRLSSRLDASIDRRRSSLKNAREPKSPKRVQFSIDDTVVSPSTSPVASRCDDAVYRNPTNPPKGAKGFEKFEVLRGQRADKTSTNGIEGSNSGSSLLAGTPTASNNADTSFGSYIQSIGRQSDTSLHLSTGTEEPFDLLDNDEDVFEFDENIAARGSSLAKDSKEEDTMDDDDGELENDSRPSLTGSSPHAGSLPIEIKWGASMRRVSNDD